jgi:hypothetical protein
LPRPEERGDTKVIQRITEAKDQAMSGDFSHFS